MELQAEFSSQNTPAMQVRGNLIRNVIPDEMRSWSATLAPALIPFRGRLNVQGRDGTGLKTLVPWVRIHSPEMSPSAQSGWYVVYLFRADGAGVALCISHGSTRFDGREFKPRSPSEAASLMTWARGLLGQQALLNGMAAGISLGSSAMLSRAYETTTAYSKTYSAVDLPSDETLAADAATAVSLLGQLYRAQELGRAPDTLPPEIIEADEALIAISRPGSRSVRATGQGFGLSAAERKIVEIHAMLAAISWLTSAGFEDIRDVHATQSCDFLARRGGIEHYVEVKGTTSAFGQIILTANEVELHRQKHPANLLIVVHGIDLMETRTKAVGGVITVLDPFVVDDCKLEALSYMCEIS